MILTSRENLCRWLEALLLRELTDPVIEVQQIDARNIRVRVTQDSGMPRYFRIKVSEEK